MSCSRPLELLRRGLPGRNFLTLGVASTALALAIAGCFNPFSPLIAPIGGISTPPPPPTTPQGVIRLFEWCWNNRSISEYKEIFTGDFRFQFANGDSAVNLVRQDFLDREMELEIAENLFVSGTAQKAPATRIVLSLDPTLLPLDDDRPGHMPRWHQIINSQVNLAIQADGEDLNVQGPVKFYVVRGDSAQIPDDLKSRFRPDSTRWWIDRWEDFTLGANTRAARDPGSLRGLTPAAALDLVLGARTTGGRGPVPLMPGYNFSMGRAKLVWYDGPLLRSAPLRASPAATR